jgi:glyoxylase-like metal-dependent hydrolase (beta-lactamase superfamily II)
MTLEGTNTWLLAEPGAGRAVVVDPGPDEPAHVDAVVAALEERGLAVATILLTHGHPDHSGCARTLGERVTAPVRALDPTFRLGSEGLGAGDVVDVDGLELRVVSTPGHSSDSLTFYLTAERSLLTGDTILGRGTTVVAHPDGRLADYLDSLQQLHALCSAEDAVAILPGHGPTLDNPIAVLDYYISHRAERLAQVEAAVAAGATTAREVVEIVYVDVDEVLWPAAELSVRAQLDYLNARP